MAVEDELKALGPRKAMVDGDQVESHSLKDLIAWDKYSRKRASTVNPFLKCARAKFVVPGPVSDIRPPTCTGFDPYGGYWDNGCGCPG